MSRLLPAGGPAAGPQNRLLGFRPTHELSVPAPPAAVVTALRERLDGGDRPLETTWAGPHLLLALPAAERHFWSPWVFVDVRPGEAPADSAGVPDASTVQVRFSPHPNVWTAIALAYLALGCIALFAGSLAWAQVVMGTTQWGWAVAGAAGLAAALLWAAGQAGQRLAHDEMHELWTLVTGALDEAGGA